MVKTSDEAAIAKAKEQNEARLKAYNQAVGEAHLQRLVLSDLTFKVNREINAEKVKSKMGFEGTLAEFSFDEQSGAVAATIEWTVSLKIGRKTFAKCAAKYHIIYDGFTVKDDYILQRFAYNVGRPATYTYFRALFASLDWASELRNPPLPVMKFFPRI